MILKAKAKVIIFNNKPVVLIGDTYFIVEDDIPVGTTAIFIAHKFDKFAYLKP
jgi:hypothetical protein